MRMIKLTGQLGGEIRVPVSKITALSDSTTWGHVDYNTWIHLHGGGGIAAMQSCDEIERLMCWDDMVDDLIKTGIISADPELVKAWSELKEKYGNA